jgi:hypothetical protein
VALDPATIPVFVVFFAVFAFLGFYGSRWRRGDLSQLHEWALAGRRLGIWLVFFLVGADLYTAYTFVAVPSGVFAKGSLLLLRRPVRRLYGSPFGSLYIAVIALGISLVITVVLSAVLRGKRGVAIALAPPGHRRKSQSRHRSETHLVALSSALIS